MADEIERRFLVKEGFDPSEHWERSSLISQSYLARTGDWTIRVREEIGRDAPRYVMTLKSPQTAAHNKEFEFPISRDHYEDVRASCGPMVVKRRYRIEHKGRTWELDLFQSERVIPSMIVEIEIEHEDEKLDLPPWVGDEITGDRWYSNAMIAQRIEEEGR